MIAVRARVSATDNLADLADCDLVIESVVEDLEVNLGSGIDQHEALAACLRTWVLRAVTLPLPSPPGPGGAHAACNCNACNACNACNLRHR